MARIALTLTIAAVLVAFSSSQNCPANKVWDECDTACPLYCHKDLTELCTTECVARCKCATGYVLKTIDSDECIRPRRCRDVPTCGPNQVYYTCGTACPKICGQPDPDVCPTICVEECQCKPGYSRVSANSTECVLTSECPA